MSQHRGGGSFTAEQLGWLAMFDTQRTGYANEIGDVHRRHELVIADLELRLRAAKANMENELTAVRQKYIPCGEYVPLEIYEFNQQCWTEYLNTCLVNNAVSAALSEESAADAVETFGEAVRQRHLLDFIMQGERRDQLLEYLNTKIKIGHFENVGEERAAKRLRILLTPAGLERPTQTTHSRVPVAAGRVNPGGTDPQANATRIFNTRFADPGEHSPIATQTHHPTEPGTLNVQQRSPYLSPLHERSGQTFRRGVQGNPPRPEYR
ncbi:uncharacterized protein LOC121989892 [Zingiber officinale]|uniref:uncharacterized protein LOC121989892 n=1 Tax=Zingiber officinale TaxID=94328 RepID=UPI001C4C0C43|nr:uncharacterized protein LOC121989892 [Zingiber officinale]